MTKKKNEAEVVEDENLAAPEIKPESKLESEPEFCSEDSDGNDSVETVDTDHLLEDARARADEHWDKLLRTQAEMENMRKRFERDLENAHKYGLEKFARELLPVKDSLEMGLKAINGETEDLTKLREGVELTLNMLVTALEKSGIKEINPVNEPFDPTFHQAMSMQESADAAPNTVLTVMQKGYQLNDRLIRPAMVIVAKASDQENTTKIDEKA